MIQSSKYCLVPVADDQRHRSPAVHIAHLLHESDLSELIQLDRVSQINFFLTERSHLLHQV
jgi:hypothetical protein